jgi:hypothetical protein
MTNEMQWHASAITSSFSKAVILGSSGMNPQKRITLLPKFDSYLQGAVSFNPIAVRFFCAKS